jgi:hypothetical protein
MELLGIMIRTGRDFGRSGKGGWKVGIEVKTRPMTIGLVFLSEVPYLKIFVQLFKSLFTGSGIIYGNMHSNNWLKGTPREPDWCKAAYPVAALQAVPPHQQLAHLPQQDGLEVTTEKYTAEQNSASLIQSGS